MLGLVGLFATAALIVSTARLNTTAASIQNAVESVYAAEELRTLLLSHSNERLLSGLEGTEMPEILEEVKEGLFQDIERYVSTSAEADLVAAVKRQVEDYFTRSLLPPREDPVQTYLALAPYFRRALASLDKLVELNINQSEEFAAAASRESRLAGLSGWALAVIIFLLVGAVLIGSRRLIYRPIITLRTAIEQFRQGSTVSNPCASCGISEFHEIGEAFREMGAMLARHREMQLRFIAGVVHDIRNPLNAIQSALSLVTRSRLDPAKQREVFAVATRQVEHLNALTKDLAESCNIEGGHITLKKGDCNLSELVTNVVQIYSSPNHQFKLRIPEKCLAYCDSLRMGRVLSNLISNAVKYSPMGGEIRIELKEEDDRIMLSVSDEGIGIASEDLPRIFEPFRRTPASEKAFEGMGLGLSVIKRIIEAHDGAIEVASTLGEGSTFVVIIPKGQQSFAAVEVAAN
ncbi:MAG: hypothetical protein J5J00_06370 [Deltaproteobacteria bacterium]|nr:hypothetical protein [Deltaproteobacteria bacterium]